MYPDNDKARETFEQLLKMKFHPVFGAKGDEILSALINEAEEGGGRGWQELREKLIAARENSAFQAWLAETENETNATPPELDAPATVVDLDISPRDES
jgi:hypothetical protein